MIKAGCGLMGLAAVSSILTGGITFSWLMLFMAGFLCVLSAICRELIASDNGWNWQKVLTYFLSWFLTGMIGLFIMIQLLIYTAGCYEPERGIAYILVPGAGIVRTEPSYTLAGRLDTAAEYLQAYPDSRVILSGGLASGQLASEAQVMAWYLEKKGVASERILLEEKASNTWENIVFSRDILYHLNGYYPEEILIVTSDYHLFRTQLLARRTGILTYGIASPSPPDLYREYALREFLALFKSMFIDWS